MMDAKGSLVACAVGRCYAYGDVGNSVVDQQVGNFLYGMLTAGAMLVDLTSGLYTPACVVEGKCLSKKVKKWGAERGYDDGSTAAALGAAIVTGGRRGGRGEMPRPRELPEGHTSSPALKGGKLSGLCNSFVSGTEVLLADGTSKPIEDLKIGDKVLATDPKTGKTKAEEVTAEILGKGEKHLVKITVDLDGQKGTKSATVTATDGHPFWVAELKQWIDATQLHEGDWLSTSTSAGTRVQVTAVERWTQRATVYNLTVTDLHTYYVLAGATPVLVHNDDDGFSGTVFRDGAYRFQIYSNDHGPAHGHLIGPGIKGDGIQIGQNGKPLNPNVELSRAQQQVIDNNLGDIRSAIRKSMAAYRLNQQGGCK